MVVSTVSVLRARQPSTITTSPIRLITREPKRSESAPEAGAIFVKLDLLDGRAMLFGPAPQSLASNDGARRFTCLHRDQTATPLDAEERLAKEARFDDDLWIVEVEDRAGRVFLDLAEE